MSLPARLLLVLIAPLLLYGCGFQPLYGKNTKDPATARLMGGVKIDGNIPGRMGQQFKADLEDRLNPEGVVPPHPRYRLNVTLNSWVSGIGAARDGTISRYNVYLVSNYILYRTSDDKKITSGKVQHVSSYNNLTNAYFSTYVSEADAISRGITELSEIYRQRLAAFLTEDPAKQAEAARKAEEIEELETPKPPEIINFPDLNNLNQPRQIR